MVGSGGTGLPREKIGRLEGRGRYSNVIGDEDRGGDGDREGYGDG